MGQSRLATAFPTGGSTSADVIRQNLALGLANVIAAADDIQDIDYSLTNKDALPDVIIVRDTLIAYARDPANPADLHDGITTLRSSDGKVFKATLVPSAFVNVLDIKNTPTGSEVAGDRYIVGTAPTGDYASNANKLTYLNGAGDWVFVTPTIGQAVYVRSVPGHYHWTDGGDWEPGIGLTTLADGQVDARELAFPWGMVAISQTATPPGTRATGGTPTMPLGGTAANINDDNSATTGVTSALGNLALQPTTARIVAKIDYGSDIAIAAIEAKQFKASTGSSSSNAMGFYYATAAAPTTLVQLGSGFTLTSAFQDFVRSGTITARYIFLVTEAKDWSTATHTLGDFNGYKQTTTLDEGSKVVVAVNGIGVFSGHDTEVAVVNGSGVYEFLTPYNGAEIFDDATGVKLRYSDDAGAWQSAAGYGLKFKRTGETTTGSVTSVGASDYVFSTGTPPTTSSTRLSDDLTLTYAGETGNTLELEYQAAVSYATANQTYTVAIYRDSDTNAIAHLPFTVGTATALANHLTVAKFYIVLADDSSHVYKAALVNANGNAVSALAMRSFTLREMIENG